MALTVRKLHKWAFLALGLPLALVGLTTFFIAHEKSLGLREVVLPIAATPEPMEIHANANIGGDMWLGTKEGVFRLVTERALPIEGGPKDDIRAMTPAADGAVLMAGKNGLWLYAKGKTVKAHDASCWHVGPIASGFSAACKDIGLLVSEDGRNWKATPIEFPSGGESAAKALSLWDLVMDIHTGKLFLGREKWVWIDVLGFSILGLAATGFMMWLRARRGRAARLAVAPRAHLRDEGQNSYRLSNSAKH